MLLCQEDQTHDCMLMVPTSSDMGWHATHVRHILCAMRMLSSILLFMHLVIYSNYTLHKCGYYNFPHREVCNRHNGKKGNKPYASCTMSALQLLSHNYIDFYTLYLFILADTQTTYYRNHKYIWRTQPHQHLSNSMPSLLYCMGSRSQCMHVYLS